MAETIVGTYRTMRGNLLRYDREFYCIIPHVCNNKGAWGKGFTAGLDYHYPSCGSTYRMYMYKWQGHGSLLGNNISAVVDDKTIVINMIAQNGLPGKDNPEPLSYGSLVECMNGVYASATGHGITEIHCPKFGCGIARGDWNIVEQMIKELWVDRGLNVTVWSL